MCHLTQAWRWPFLPCIQSVVSTEGQQLKPVSKPQLPDCRGHQCLMSWDMEDSEDCLRFLQMDPHVFLHILTPYRLIL